MLQETDWIKLKQTWLALGPNRDLRTLQRHIQHLFRMKMPLDLLQTEVNKRGWTIDAIEHDSKINQKIDAITIDNLAKELAAERINGWRKLRDQANEFSSLMTLMLPKAKKYIEGKAVIPLDEARKFMETLIKVREFMDAQEVPMMPGEDDAIGASFSNPAELGRALMNAAQLRDLRVTDLEALREPSHGGKN